jgi:hypothetical protein
MLKKPNILSEIIKNAQDQMLKHKTAIDNDDHWLYECRVLSLSTGRQSGNTTRIAEIFNPVTDVYITTRIHELNQFIDMVGYNNFRYQLLSSRDYTLHLNALRGNPVQRVFIDLSIGLMVKTTYPAKISKMIELIDEYLGVDANPIYVIS